VKTTVAIIITLCSYTTTITASDIVYKASDEISEEIRNIEKFTPCAFKDHKGVSIGYGTQKLENNKIVPLKIKGRSFCITEERARTLSDKAIQMKTDLIIALAYDTNLEINQKILDSLVSFSYNIGFDGFYKSSVLSHLNHHKCKLAIKSMLTYTKASGKVLKGLVLRRQHEARLLEQGCKELKTIYKDVK
jgi:GH24 family phage-related lysozyme (muramidase)